MSYWLHKSFIPLFEAVPLHPCQVHVVDQQLRHHNIKRNSSINEQEVKGLLQSELGMLNNFCYKESCQLMGAALALVLCWCLTFIPFLNTQGF